MRSVVVVAWVGLLTAFAAIGAGTAPAAPVPSAESAPTSFAFAIGNGNLKGTADATVARFGQFDLVIVDGEEATKKQVRKLRKQGSTVLAYLSVGTIEKWRGWYRKLKPYRLKAWQDWDGEWFADTSRSGYRKAITKIARKRILAKGFDGLFLDNVDMVEASRYRKQRKGMGKVVRSLDRMLGKKRLLYAQNGYRGVMRGYPKQNVKPLWHRLDGWNREDVSWTWDFDRKRYKRNPDSAGALTELRRVAKRGLVTLATDYIRLKPFDVDAACESRDAATGVGALSYVADIGLTSKALPFNPVACDT